MSANSGQTWGTRLEWATRPVTYPLGPLYFAVVLKFFL